MKLTNIALATILGTACTMPATASQLYTLDIAITTTGVSGGSTSYNHKRVGGTSGFKAINRITNYERQDTPCKMKVKMRHFNNYKETTDSEELLSNCNNDKITVGFSNTETYVSAVQVCTRTGSKVKGLRVWGRKLNRSTGALASVGRVEDKRPNCNTWETKQSCPTGKVATEIKANYTGYLGGNTFQGISLVCQAIVPK